MSLVSPSAYLPREITALHNETIVDVSMSDTHALCVNARGQVYAWGLNVSKSGSRGILGHSDMDYGDVIMVSYKR